MSIFKKKLSVHFDNADIIFVDPCYFVKDESVWEEYSEDFAVNKNLSKLGCEQSICYGFGDVQPDVMVNEDDCTVIGALTSDSCLLGCFRLEDVLAYNPEYADEMNKYPDSYCLVKGFTGDVVFETKKEKYYDEVLPITTIIGRGSSNIHSGFIDDDDSVKLKLSECNMD